MVFVNKTLEEMMSDIGFNNITHCEYLVPSKEEERYGDSGYYLDIDITYVRALLEKHTPALKINSYDDYAAICLALENAFTHGNKTDRSLPVSITFFSGESGDLIRIMDSGVGFDYQQKIRQLRAGDITYTERGGAGLRRLDEAAFEAAYEDLGNILTIMIKNPQTSSSNSHFLN